MSSPHYYHWNLKYIVLSFTFQYINFTERYFVILRLLRIHETQTTQIDG